MYVRVHPVRQNKSTPPKNQSQISKIFLIPSSQTTYPKIRPPPIPAFCGPQAHNTARMTESLFSEDHRKHLAVSSLIPGESPEAFQRLVTEYDETFQPRTPFERGLVDDMILTAWRKHRLTVFETHILLWNIQLQIEMNLDAKCAPAPALPPTEIRQITTRTHPMTSASKIAANQAKAQHSTGHRTPEGRAKVAPNGITLGLFSGRDAITPMSKPNTRPRGPAVPRLALRNHP